MNQSKKEWINLILHILIVIAVIAFVIEIHLLRVALTPHAFTFSPPIR